MSAKPENLDVWVLAGQSNMEGCAELSGSVGPDDNVWLFSSAGKWEKAEDPLHHLWESYTPVHQRLMRRQMAEEFKNHTDEQMAKHNRETRVNGTGPGLSFGKAMVEATGRPVGLIAAAHGGTNLNEWSPKYNDLAGDQLYGAMLRRIKDAGGNLKGVLWYQGESDAWPFRAYNYGSRMIAWINALRNDVGIPDLPVLLVQIGNVVNMHDEVTRKNGWCGIRDALYYVPEVLDNVSVTSAIDLGLIDSIHINAHSHKRLGRRLARQALALTGEKKYLPGPRFTGFERLPNRGNMGQVRIDFEGVTGGWLPEDRMYGFGIYNLFMQPHPEAKIINVGRSPDNPCSIQLRASVPLDPDLIIAYGWGENTTCNVCDEADMPLCAFQIEVL